MTVKKQFIVREIMGEYILVPTGTSNNKLFGLVSLNETGLFLWNKLPEVENEAALTDALTSEYDVTAETAAADIAEFLAKLREHDII